MFWLLRVPFFVCLIVHQQKQQKFELKSTYGGTACAMLEMHACIQWQEKEREEDTAILYEDEGIYKMPNKKNEEKIAVYAIYVRKK